MEKFINILQFLTRIKVKNNVKYDPKLSTGIIYFPTVGAVIGIIITLLCLLSMKLLTFSGASVLVAIIIVLAEVFITGGLHIDGLGDTFDGIFSYRSREEILIIMKDSRLGTNGLLAIVFLILIKVFILNVFIQKYIIWPIFLMPVVGRYVAVFLTYKTRPAKSSGMGNTFIGKCDIGTLLACTSLVSIGILVLSLVFTGDIVISFMSIISIPILIFLSTMFQIGIYKKIGGLTGDVLGCSIELAELIFIIYILIIVS
ncbi:adenosylcobinamide-GDP ribazoletransferase [Peptostreptococcus equinus]|uniref:Adenosylcobinamide-GDP ribazoletransferase n=1 Tax=Peptostreptococcus equinus TaxID=3003601 RepID=A0ABY7JP12_9FIRM|nr:adenosylcobinamide-GDP ribazoletransferase [Peptostreptococcus sp. CBA3647]WAW15087.1 adenosylcobinamide-GDP ribazoletransferase [Peptostreptococcus sp. CBA3647]